MSKLEFLKTLSVEDFKKAQNVDKVEILQNKSTGKCFFTFGSSRGVVSSKYPLKPFKNPVVSEVYSEDSKKSFFLLHDEPDRKVVQMGVL